MALTRDGRILGVRDRFLFDTGAYDPYGLTIPINTQCTLLGPYDIEHYESEFTAVFTNRTIVTPVRGAGRQHGVFVSERLLDIAARELGIDRVEIRKRNLLRPEQFPHNHGIMFQDSAPLLYDSGDYLPALERAAEIIGYDQFRREDQARLRAEGKHVGIGVACYVEGTGIGPYEGARVTVEPSGKVRVATGVGTQGQGHYTVFAQIVADELAVDVEDVQVITGDTREFQWGTGTFASRGAVVAGSACHAAARAVRDKALALAGQLLDAPLADLELTRGRISVRSDSARGFTLAELAGKANPLRGAVRPGTKPGLEATEYFGPDRGSTASGVHAMLLEVDAETAAVTIKRYVVVHDCGTIINPMIVQGQVHGGLTEGFAIAFMQEIQYDQDGNNLNTNFTDYLVPTSLESPAWETAHTVTPSPHHPIGAKGVGESPNVGSPAAFVNAVIDALSPLGVRHIDMPLTRDKVWRAIRDADAKKG
jgi:CO/xanthine dehydrogenase Mo-binding subunit